VAILPIVEYPAEVLAKTAAPVVTFDDTLRQLAHDMAETMYAAPGVGLAAPQVGQSIRMVVIDVSEDKNGLITLVNPTVEAIDDEFVVGEEGCLSLPEMKEKVKRSAKVHVKAFDLEGRPFEFDAKDLLSVCVQHEVDHLNGLVYIDHVSPLKKSRIIAKLAKQRREKSREKKKTL